MNVALIQDVVAHIEDRIGDGLPLTELAGRAGISGFHFNRLFKTVD